MEKIKVVTTFSGYDSQCLALKYLGIPFELVGWSEVNKYAIQAHNLLFPEYKDRLLGDITKIDWSKVEDFDFLTYSSPCFVKGTLILTDKGYKPIEEIVEGDKVITHTNTFRGVVKPMQRHYEGRMYKIITPSVVDVTCTENHPLYVRPMTRKGYKQHRFFGAPLWLDPQKITEKIANKEAIRYYIGYAVNNEAKFPSWNGTIDNRFGHAKPVNQLSKLFTEHYFWYLMGRYVGDGWKNSSTGIIICCGGRNEETLKESISLCGFNYSVLEERTVRKYNIAMNELNEFVDRYGYYAYGKCIDSETMNLPVPLLKSFLHGLMESDGCRVNKLCKITTTSERLAYGIGQCVAKVYQRPFSLNKSVRPRKTVIEGRTVNQHDTYTASWKETNDKQDKAFYENGCIWYPIHSLESFDASCNVYNMEVDTDNSYTANGLIVHNCQDISNAGLRRGLEKGSGTRSSLLWEVEKCIENKRPRFLMMENVAALVSKNFIGGFKEWLKTLEGFGYTNYAQKLNARDYGIPQNRDRVFVVSVRDDLSRTFNFPSPIKLTRRLKDVLEKNADEKFYLSDNIVQAFLRRNIKNKAKGNGFKFVAFRMEETDTKIAKAVTGKMDRVTDNFIQTSDCAKALRANEAARQTDNYICDKNEAGLLNGNGFSAPSVLEYKTEKIIQVGNLVGEKNFSNPQRDRVYSPQGVAPALNCVNGGGQEPKILGYSQDAKGKVVNRHVNDYANTITQSASGGSSQSQYVIEYDNQKETLRIQQSTKLGYAEVGKGGVFNIANIASKSRRGRVQEGGNIVPTIDTNPSVCRFEGATCLKEESEPKHDNVIMYKGKEVRDGDGLYLQDSENFAQDGATDVSRTLKASKHDAAVCVYPRIRKLTPRECFRLMGVSEADIDKIQQLDADGKQIISNSQQYKLAGNSIVTNVMEANLLTFSKKNKMLLNQLYFNMATIFYTDGLRKDVSPKNKRDFSAEELHAIVDGYFELVRIGGEHYMVVNEDGIRLDLPFNLNASLNAGQQILGNVIVIKNNEIK